MATTDKASILRAVYDAFNARDLKKLKGYATADARATNIPLGVTAGFVEDFEGWAQAFPDGQVEVRTAFAQGDRGVVEIIGRGTHNGPLKSPNGDVAATGRRVELHLAEFFEFRNDKIVGMRYYFDAFSLYRQLGIGAPELGAESGASASPH
jgi:predicted ester cyclase